MSLHKFVGRLLMFGALIAPALNCLSQQIALPTGTLLSREAVKIRVTTTSPFALGRESVTMVNNKLTVTMRSFENLPDPGPAPPSEDVSATSGDVILGKLPQGSYTVEVVFLNRLNNALSPVASGQFSVGNDLAASLSGFPAYDFTDLWWNPNESGWGISIHVKRELFFAAWFVYDATGKPTWYTLQAGRWVSPVKYTGLIYVTHANSGGGLGPISSLTVTEVGSGTIIFNNNDTADFTYTVDGIQRSKSIMRQAF